MDGSQKYDIFISYRRATGANAARMMQLALTARGYSVFLDFKKIEGDNFAESICSAIDSCEVFMLVMTDGSLDRCEVEGDFVRVEIQRAIEKKKRIVPVVPSDQKWGGFPAHLPEELSVLRELEVSKLDMTGLFNESVAYVEDRFFPKELKDRRRSNVLAPATSVDGDAWVFLSHSHEDYDKVIQVRNLLEARRFRPLMFFLKCLEEDCEIDALIKREIDSRSRFVLCDSKSARASRWVNEEVAYIKSKNRTFEVLDLDVMSVEQIDAKLRAFEQRLIFTVFFSRGRQGEMNQVFNKLQAYGFRAQWNMLERTDDVEQLRDKLISLSKHGYVALYPDGESEDFCTMLTKDLPADHGVWVVSHGEDLPLYRVIDGGGYEDAMILSQFANAESRVELLECIAYGGRPSLKVKLGFMFERGEHGVKVDLRRALKYFEDAYDDDGIDTHDHVRRIKEKLDTASQKKRDDGDWVRHLSACPGFLDNRSWARLDGNDWSRILSVHPQLANRCPWEKLSGKGWCRVLSAQPQFAAYCSWEKLSGRDWGELLSVQPQFLDRCPWEKLDGDDWGVLMSAQPLFADHCAWEKLDGRAWSRILCAQPQFHAHCQWEKLSSKDWGDVLSVLPCFADSCPWEKLDGETWSKVLSNRPQFAARCPWKKLNGRDWCVLLSVQPQFVDLCPWEKLSDQDWYELLQHQPLFAKWRKNKSAENHSDNG